MGSGKTSVGQVLSRRTGYPFLDTDEVIVEVEGTSIAAIFREKGEDYFRAVEQKVVREVASRRGVIISTGGGVLKDPENLKALQEGGVLVWLETEPEVVLRRTMTDGGARPLLNVDEPLHEISKLLDARRPFYSAADIRIDTSYITVGETVNEISDRLALDGRRVRVELGERGYDILIGRGLVHGLGARITGLRPTRVAVVSNPTVYGLYGEALERALEPFSLDPVRILVPDGEEYKDMLWLGKILGELLSHGFDRGSLVIALGGGVIGDLAGFAAAIFMRGIRCVQVPTTLLAQVDSSVGGKTGVNHALGKNMIGAFFQPSLVLMDQDFLATLPEREMRAGLAEIIKYGVIWDSALFETLSKGKEEILGLGPLLGEVVERSCRIKAEVVAEDERESGLRAILNFGHTVGHAVETVSGYKTFLHGEAIAIGMRVAADLAVGLKMLSKAEAQAIRRLISAYGLPVTIPPGLSPETLLGAMYHDKKALGRKIRFVLPSEIGRVRIVKDLPEPLILKALTAASQGRK